ncbi:MAG: hypothetical protein AAGA03_14315 [Planctomycetota bacterium]
MTANSFQQLLSILVKSNVDFILVGGLAGIVAGATRATYDVDIVYSRSRQNLKCLVDAMSPHDPYLRGLPPGLPFSFDLRTLENGLNFTLTTKLGDIDLLGEITGGGDYDQLIPDSTRVEIFGLQIRSVTLSKLIQLKRAAGRPKDLEAIAELELLLAHQENGPSN